MGKAKMKTKWLQDSSPESLQHLPEKTPSTSGFQHRRPKAANQEINTGQPVRSSSPQPSTSGLHLNRDWRTRRSRPQASTSGFKRGREEADQEEVHPGRRVRRSSPRPSTSGFQRGRQVGSHQEVNRKYNVCSQRNKPSSCGAIPSLLPLFFNRGREEAEQEEQEHQRFRSGYYRVQTDTDGSRPTMRFPYWFLPNTVNDVLGMVSGWWNSSSYTPQMEYFSLTQGQSPLEIL
ncbi:uncharacterized protein LOC102077748 isoform X1 [Oreochromis niloticus]|uniref:uncharacterized protein LOC102077748 isoform X1 n=1 Tax=Oreochromis niloticus TaxID=8128 RepID=UPI0003946C47|nr:uncharacterized protein LOC102077748 isoform X1 [Oreochromis niloticus]